MQSTAFKTVVVLGCAYGGTTISAVYTMCRFIDDAQARGRPASLLRRFQLVGNSWLSIAIREWSQLVEVRARKSAFTDICLFVQ